MQQLCEILIHKMQLMTNKQNHTLPISQKQQLLERLLIQKKKQALRILVETRLQQSLNNRAFVEHAELIEFHSKSFEIMQIADQNMIQQKHHDSLHAIVELYIQFFARQSCGLRAQEIQNIYKKRLCPKALLPATLFNWLVEWTRKQFQEFLKTNIHSLYISSRQPIHARQTATPVQEENTPQPFFIIFQKPATQHRRNIVNSSFQAKREQSPRKYFSSKQIEQGMSKSPSPSEKDIKLLSIEPEDTTPINKQIFYNAYAEQMQSLYKQLQDCMDLDSGFVRRLKKGGRRKEVKKRIHEVIGSITKNMGAIKHSIQVYGRHYGDTHKTAIKRQQSKIKQKLINSNSKQIRSSHGSRIISSSERISSQQRQRLVSSLGKKNRYDQPESNSQSNLLISPRARVNSVQITKDRWQAQSKTLDISLDLSHNGSQSKRLLIHAGKFSSELQIIQERAKKVRNRLNQSKHLHQNIIVRKSQKRKSKQMKSLQSSQLHNQVAYTSLPVTIEVDSRIEHLKLPKLRRLK